MSDSFGYRYLESDKYQREVESYLRERAAREFAERVRREERNRLITTIAVWAVAIVAVVCGLAMWVQQ